MSTETKTKIYWAVIIASTVGAFVAAQILIKVTWPAALVAGIAFFLTRPYAKKIIFNEQDLARKRLQWQIIGLGSQSAEQLRDIAETIRSHSFGDIQDAVAKCLESGDRSERGAAARILAILGDERAIPTLVEALGSKKTRQRQEALESLGQLKWSPDDQDTATRAHQLMASGRFGELASLGEEALPVIRTAMKRHKNDATVRFDLVQALAGFNDKEATQMLLAAAQDKSAPVRAAATKVLDSRPGLDQEQQATLAEIRETRSRQLEEKRQKESARRKGAGPHASPADPSKCSVCGAARHFTETVNWEMHLVTAVFDEGNEFYSQTNYQWASLDSVTTRLCKKCLDEIKGFLKPDPHEQVLRKRLDGALPGIANGQIERITTRKVKSAIKTMSAVKQGTILIWRGRKNRESMYGTQT